MAALSSPAAASYAAYVALCALLHWAFASVVREPYMDEPFHVGQAQAYCEGRWAEWDDKITTFPGLYLVAASAANAANSGGGAATMTCTLSSLRALNLIPALATPALLHALLRALHPHESPRDVAANAAVLSMLPTHFFFHFLFYTDSFATCSVLALLLCLHSFERSSFVRHVVLGLAAAAAIAFRQTNAAWVAFAIGSGLLADLHAIGALSSSATVGTALREALHAVPVAVPGLIARRYLLPTLVLVGFAAFVVVNGGVVVGDKGNHAPAVHTAQLLYLTVLASAPFSVEALTVRAPETLRAALRATRASPASAALAVCAALALARGTLCHPFLLADNRHVTFYLWRHLLGRHWLARYALAPGYALLGCRLYPLVWRRRTAPDGGGGPVLALGLLVCAALVLVPSPLIEPRYLTLPTLLLRLHAVPPLRGPREWLPALFAFACLNAAMLFLFLGRPYTWGDGSVARFMW